MDSDSARAVEVDRVEPLLKLLMVRLLRCAVTSLTFLWWVSTSLLLTIASLLSTVLRSVASLRASAVLRRSVALLRCTVLLAKLLLLILTLRRSTVALTACRRVRRACALDEVSDAVARKGGRDAHSCC